jgi:hypothetical protein
MQIIEYIVDKYLSCRTGLGKQERLWRKWQEETIVRRASTIENMFMNFKYILPVSDMIFNHAEPFGWVPCRDFQQYMYPARDLDNCTVYCFARGYRDKWDGQFHLNDLRHEQDQVFVATNNERDAIMIALKYS